MLEVSIESQFLFSFYDKDSLVHLVKSTLVKLSPGGKTARGDAEPRKDVEKCGKPDQVRCQYVHRKVCQVSILPAVRRHQLACRLLGEPLRFQTLRLGDQRNWITTE